MFQTGRLFIQQIFSSYFSIPLLLYCFPITARHRSFLLSAAKRGTLARFPLSRPRLVSVSLPPSLPPPVICRENWLRNIFNCPSIFNGRRRRRRRKKFQIDRFFRSSLSSCKTSNRRDKNIYTSYIYTQLFKRTRSLRYQKLTSTKRKISPRWNHGKQPRERD